MGNWKAYLYQSFQTLNVRVYFVTYYNSCIPFENELVADAFAGLSVQEQSILILHFVLDLPDQEVGRLVGMSRSAVQRRRAKSLTELRIKLTALMPKGG